MAETIDVVEFELGGERYALDIQRHVRSWR